MAKNLHSQYISVLLSEAEVARRDASRVFGGETTVFPGSTNSQPFGGGTNPQVHAPAVFGGGTPQTQAPLVGVEEGNSALTVTTDAGKENSRINQQVSTALTGVKNHVGGFLASLSRSVQQHIPASSSTAPSAIVGGGTGGTNIDNDVDREDRPVVAPPALATKNGVVEAPARPATTPSLATQPLRREYEPTTATATVNNAPLGGVSVTGGTAADDEDGTPTGNEASLVPGNAGGATVTAAPSVADKERTGPPILTTASALVPYNNQAPLQTGQGLLGTNGPVSNNNAALALVPHAQAPHHGTIGPANMLGNNMFGLPPPASLGLGLNGLNGMLGQLQIDANTPTTVGHHHFPILGVAAAAANGGGGAASQPVFATANFASATFIHNNTAPGVVNNSGGGVVNINHYSGAATSTTAQEEAALKDVQDQVSSTYMDGHSAANITL